MKIDIFEFLRLMFRSKKNFSIRKNEFFFIKNVLLSKNSFASDIEKNIETMKISNNSFVENIVDMKISNEKFFEFACIFDQKTKNSFVLHVKNIEISIAMNMLFFEHFINENNFIIEILIFVIEIITFSKISLI